MTEISEHTMQPTHFTLEEADLEAKRRWGYRGVAIMGPLCMVGYFQGITPDDPYARPPYPWVKCGEGGTWVEAFQASDESA